MNQGFDKYYFDNKMNELADEVVDIFKKTNDKNNAKSQENFKEKDNLNLIFKDRANLNITRRNKRYETVGPNTFNSKIFFRNINFNTYSKENEKKKEIVRKRIEILKNNQEKFENNFKEQIQTFLDEFKNEIIKLKTNQIEQK